MSLKDFEGDVNLGAQWVRRFGHNFATIRIRRYRSTCERPGAWKTWSGTTDRLEATCSSNRCKKLVRPTHASGPKAPHHRHLLPRAADNSDGQ